MASKATWRIRDHSGEMSSFSVPGLDLTAANLVAQQSLIAALQAATQDIIIGVIAEETVLLSRTVISGALPASGGAQRELKWLVTYTDLVADEVHQAEIPTMDFSNLAGNTENLDVSPGSQGETFVNAFEAFVRAKGLNAVNVDSVRLVGRNL